VKDLLILSSDRERMCVKEISIGVIRDTERERESE
jgi:hypothetical protein